MLLSAENFTLTQHCCQGQKRLPQLGSLLVTQTRLNSSNIIVVLQGKLFKLFLIQRDVWADYKPVSRPHAGDIMPHPTACGLTLVTENAALSVDTP